MSEFRCIFNIINFHVENAETFLKNGNYINAKHRLETSIYYINRLINSVDKTIQEGAKEE